MAAIDDLKTDVAAWMNRTDLTAQIPGFIRIAESRINLDVRSWQMIESLELTQPVDTNLIDVPADWLEWDKLSINGRQLDYVRPDVMQAFIQGGDTTDLGKYTMVGGKLIIDGPPVDPPPVPPPAPVVVQTTYYKRLPALDSAPGGSTWLWDLAPAVYLYGALASACAYVKDEARARVYGSAFQDLIADVNSKGFKAPISGSTWRQRPGVGAV